jgi:hypothetical protein
MSAPRITWNAGATASLVAVDGIHVTVHSTKAFPPGAPVTGTFHADDGNARAFTLKVTNSRKVGDATWEVRGRLVAATVDVVAAFARGPFDAT